MEWKAMESLELGELIPGLPEDLALECVTRLSFSSHHMASGVCRRWKELIRSNAFYKHRKATGFTRKLACFVQAASIPSGSKASPLGVVLFDPITRFVHRLDPVPKYHVGLPLFCQIASCDGKIVVMGGWDPITYDSVTDVFIYDFVAGTWKEGAPMPEKRSFHAIGSGSTGKIYVSGGHDVNKNALSSAWAYDVAEDKWTQIAPMSKERDECEGFVVVRKDGKEEFWVVGGYATESQGSFAGDAEVYDADTGAWRLEDGAWKAGRCPRGSVGMVGGALVCWTDMVEEEAPKIGPNAVIVGDRLIATGSDLPGGCIRFYLVDLKGGKTERVEADELFSGYVQSSCCVEI